MGTLANCLRNLPQSALTESEIATLKQLRSDFMRQGQTQVQAELSAVQQALTAAVADRRRFKLQINNDPGAGFAPASEAKVSAVRDVIAKAFTGWKGDVQFEVLSSQEPLADRYGLTENTEGIFLPSENKVYVFANALTEVDRAVWVALHEVVGHRGVMSLFKSPQDFTRALAQASMSRTFRSVARRIAEARGLNFADQRELVESMAEAMAEIAAADQTGDWGRFKEQYGINAFPMRRDLLGALARFIEAVKDAINTMLGVRIFRDVENLEANAFVRDLIAKAATTLRDAESDARPARTGEAYRSKLTYDAAGREARKWKEFGRLENGLPQYRAAGFDLIPVGEVPTVENDDATPLEDIEQLPDQDLLGHAAWVPDGSRMYKFQIRDKQGAYLGSLRADVDDRTNQITAIHNIQIKPSLRGEGVGRAVVESILANARGDVRIVEILEDSEGFWYDKLGSEEDGDRRFNNAVASWRALVVRRLASPGLRGGDERTTAGRSGVQTDAGGLPRGPGTGPAGASADGTGSQDEGLSLEGYEVEDLDPSEYANFFDAFKSVAGAKGKKPAGRGAGAKLFIAKWFLLSLTPVDALRDWASKGIRPHAERFEADRRRIEADRSNLATRFGALADEWVKVIGKSAEDADLLAGVMHEATLAGYDPAVGYGQPFQPAYTLDEYKRDKQDIYQRHSNAGELSEEGQRLLDGVDARLQFEANRRKAKPALDAKWARLSEGAKRVYEKARDNYRDQTEAYEQALRENIDKQLRNAYEVKRLEAEAEIKELRQRAIPAYEVAEQEEQILADLQKAFDRAEQARKVAVAKLDEKFQSYRTSEPYFPLMRFGQYWVAVKDRITGELVQYEKFESASEWERFKEAAREKGRYIVTDGVDGNADEQRGEMGVDASFVADVMATLEGNSLFDDATVEEIEKQIYDLYLSRMPDLSIRKRFMRRTGVKGFSNDAFKAYAHHTNHASMQTARLRYKADFDLTMLRMRAALADDDQVSSKERGLQSLIVEEFGRAQKHLFNPASAPLASAVTGLAFNFHLGLSPGAALVNMTQPAIVAMPMIGAKYGNGTASLALARAMKDVSWYGKRRDVDGHIKANKRISREEAAALNAAADSGVISRTQTADLTAMSNAGSGQSPTTHRYQQVMRGIGKMFHAAEVFNREQVYLAAYRLARKGAGAVQPLDDAQARDYAEEVTRRSQFGYEASNRPRFMRHDVMRAVLVFRNYHVNMAYRILRDTWDSVRGSDTRTRAEAAKQLGTTLGMFTMVAGVGGVPFISTLLWLIGHAFDDEDETVKEAFEQGVMDVFGRDVGELILRGALNAVTGVDFASRVGMGNIWTRDQYGDEKDSIYDAWVDFIIESLGAGLGVAGQIARGVSIASDGDAARGVETAMPKAVRDLVKAVRYVKEGVVDLKGAELVSKEDISALQALAQASGVTPTEVSYAYEDKARMTARRDRLQRSRQNLLRRYHKAKKSEDLDQVDAVMEEIESWNVEYGALSKDLLITKRVLRRSLQSKRRSDEATRDGVFYTGDDREFIEDARLFDED